MPETDDLSPTELELLVVRTPAVLASLGVDPVLIWSATIALVAALNGWSLDEASANMANLLDELHGPS